MSESQPIGSLFDAEANMQPTCAFPDAADREFVWETLRMDVVDLARQESALQALDRIFDRFDQETRLVFVLEWDGNLETTDYRFIDLAPERDVTAEVRLSMSEWVDRGHPMTVTVEVTS